MKPTIGLDFGGCNTVIYVKEKGIVLREPSVAAVDPEGNVIAVGREALLIRGRTPGSVTIRRPIRDSVISDFNLTAEMLDRFLAIAAKGTRRRVAVAVKCGVDTRHRELILAALADCRASRAQLVESPLAALSGAEIDDSEGILVCDIGAGSIECTFVKGGDILRSETFFGGGRDADKAIRDYLRRRYGLAVTKIAAQNAKHKLSLLDDDAEPLVLAGLDTTTGLPKKAAVAPSELLRCCAPQIKGAADCITAVLENLPRPGGEELSVSQVVLIGGGAQLPGIREYISEVCAIEAIIPPTPVECIARGLGKLIESE